MKVKLIKVRLAFPALWTPETFKNKDGTVSKPKYGATALFAPTHPAKDLLVHTIKEVARAEWGDKWEINLKSIKAGGNHLLRNGDAKPDYDGYPGNLFIKGSNKTRPLVLDRDGTTPLAESDGVIYAGCYVNMMLDVWAQKKTSGWGIRVNAALIGVQYHSPGDAFGASAKATPDDFEDLGQGEGAPTGGDDDDNW